MKKYIVQTLVYGPDGELDINMSSAPMTEDKVEAFIASQISKYSIVECNIKEA